jgi:hypothetical protein
MRGKSSAVVTFFSFLALFAALAAEKSTRAVAGAGFWRLLILMEEPVVEVRRGVGGVVVADANVVAATAL